MKLYWTIALTLLVAAAYGQILNPVKWDMKSRHVNADEYDLIFTARMDAGWTIYSQFIEEGGPIPTSFHFNDGGHYQRKGAVKEEGKKKEGMDPIFDMNVIKFVQSPVVFTQRVTVSDPGKAITGYLEFMTCNDEQCLPPDEVEFSFKVTPPAGATKSDPAKTGAAIDKPSDKVARTTETAAATPPTNEQTKPVDPTNTLSATAQEPPSTNQRLLDPIQWSVTAEQQSENRYNLTITAKLDEGWTLYSQHTDDNGPTPTSIYFEGEGYRRIGETVESGGKKKQGPDDYFGGVTVIKFVTGPVLYTQQIEVTDPTTELTGIIEYMTCNDAQCLPTTEVPFKVTFNPLQVSIGETGELAIAVDPLFGDEPTAPANEQYAGLDPSSLAMPVAGCGDEEATAIISANTNHWRLFFLGFVGGLLALLTPCVFPMIPLTVSFFTKSSDSKAKGIRDASLYGFFILLVYLLLSLPFHLMDSVNPDILNDISTNVWLNVAFFLIFLIFAFSFFGYYELTLPASWTNRASSAEGVGGMVGIFFMALTLALVSFSCTGPILGSLLAGALTAEGGAMQLTAGMSGFGLALALPFAVFAAFPGMLKSLPKSGGWLTSVKVVLGFLELALALKFLSNADLVKHWGVLRIELFLGLWILIGVGMALYLFGLLRFPHDGPIKKLSPLRLGLGALTVAFVLYLASGFLPDARSGSYRPLGLLSGLAPPVCYSFFNACDCPQGLDCFKDLEAGLAYAQRVNKPVMIDFTGYACVNCRKMEEHVWPTPEVYRYLKDDYVLISLYVDDRQELPADEQITVTKSTGGTRKLTTYGKKWSHFQTEFFNVNSQPYYVLLTPDGQRLLNQPVAYTPDEDDYSDFLRCGLENFQRWSQLGSSN